MEQIEQLKGLMRQHFRYGHVHVAQTEPEYQLSLFYRQPNQRLKEPDILRDAISGELPPSRRWFTTIEAGAQPTEMPIRANDALTRIDLLATPENLSAICAKLQHAIGGQYKLQR